MFHRRLLLLAVSAVAVIFILGTQTVRLSVGAEHAQRKAAAERALQESHPIPTVRGRVLDRYDRPLAIDEPGYEVAVRYRMISGEWAYQQARATAREQDPERWKEMDSAEQRRLTDELIPGFEAKAQELWDLLAEITGEDPLEVTRRKNSIRRVVQRGIASKAQGNQRKRKTEFDESLSWMDARERIQEEDWAHTIVSDINDQTRISILGFIAGAEDDPNLAAWQDVEVRQPRQRRYPNETFTVSVDRSTLPTPLRHEEPIQVTVQGVALHHLGLLRSIWASDESIDPYSADNPRGYLPGDQIGRWGIEKALEDRLRGTRGLSTTQLDTGETKRIEPIPGKDVHLTLDIQLQAQVQALMSPEIGLMTAQPYQPYEDNTNRKPGWQLNGSAVVLEIDSGEVLAAVSIPAMPLQTLREDSEAIFDDHVNMPYLNRIVSRPYQPGSTVKPVVLASAVTAGKLSLGEQIECTGFLDPSKPEGLRCWIYKQFSQTHGALHGHEAIMHSCNIYFYTVGRRMGLSRLSHWYSNFGLGRVTGCGLPEEVTGDLPDPDKTPGGQDLADATFMGIGQGPIRWTPIQAANAYVTLVRGGIWTSPTFIKDQDRLESRDRVDLRLNAAGVREALQGLDDVVNNPSSSSRNLRVPEGREPIFNVEGVKLYAKTGTAEGVPHRVDADGDERITTNDPIVKSGDHAWVMCLVQPEGHTKPKYVVAVVVEYAGGGSQVAGPIVNQIVHVLQREGYLN
jgi:cell division protein FtsI/penicillin-binding protein 2